MTSTLTDRSSGAGTSQTVNAAPVTLTYAATIDWVWLTSGVNLELTLTGDATLNFPTRLDPGTWRYIRVIQDSTGGWTLSLETSAGFYTTSGGALALNETASSWALLKMLCVSETEIAVYPENGPMQAL